MFAVVKVVYSRDCEAHNEVVWRLCTLLRSELGLAVEYDEGAPGRAHLSADWALAMADVACPLFPGADGAPEGHRRERLLVIESEGGLIKQAAYRRDKVGGRVVVPIEALRNTTEFNDSLPMITGRPAL